jgi:Zn-dependent peptidase ImmA (M78 family)
VRSHPQSRYLRPSERLRRVRKGLAIPPGLAAEFTTDPRVTEERIEAIERGTGKPPTRAEVESLSRLYGIPWEELASPDFRLDKIKVLFLLQDQHPSTEAKLAVGRIAHVARSYRSLEQALGRPDRYVKLLHDWVPDSRYGDKGQEYKQGIRLSRKVRERLNLQSNPIKSIQEILDKVGILLLFANLPEAVAGIAVIDPSHGPTIAVNLAGRNENLWFLRFTLAHELCHVVFDRGNQHALARYDGYSQLDSSNQKQERRANAFAAHLLAPSAGFRADFEQQGSLAERLRRVMERFGLHYKAATKHIPHHDLASSEDLASVTVDHRPSPEWKTLEKPRWIEDFPWEVVRAERRGSFARLVVSAWKAQFVTTSRLYELLDGDHQGDPQQLVDYFGNDLLQLPSA